MTDFQNLHWEQALAAFDRGYLQESIEHFHRAIERQPANSDLHFNLAVALDRVGDVQSASVEYRKAIHLNPLDASLHYGLGAHLLKTEQWDMALASFRHAEHLQPGYPDALNRAVVTLGRKAKALRQLGGYLAYLDAVDERISQCPQTLLWRESRSWVLWEMGRRTEAAAEAEAVLSLEPTSRNYSRLLHYQRQMGHLWDFLRTSRGMIRFEFQRGWRRLKWEESRAERK